MATDPFANRDRDEDADELAFLMQLFSQRRSRRVNFEQQWEESAALAWPEYMSSFFYGRDVAPGMKRTNASKTIRDAHPYRVSPPSRR